MRGGRPLLPPSPSKPPSPEAAAPRAPALRCRDVTTTHLVWTARPDASDQRDAPARPAPRDDGQAVARALARRYFVQVDSSLTEARSAHLSEPPLKRGSVGLALAVLRAPPGTQLASLPRREAGGLKSPAPRCRGPQSPLQRDGSARCVSNPNSKNKLLSPPDFWPKTEKL